MVKELDLTTLVGKADRDMLVAGLQALWRERVNAMRTLNQFRHETGVEELDDHSEFGIDRVNEMLVRCGCAPAQALLHSSNLDYLNQKK